MVKYINTTKFKLIVSHEKELIHINAGDTLTTDKYIPGLDQFLVEDIKPKQEQKLAEVSDIEEDQKSELPEDYIVLVSDAIVEELKQEEASKRKTRSRRRTKK